jgi:predicted nucleic acid-binding protein
LFVDTSAFIAVLDADDPHHAEAGPYWVEAVRERREIVTTNYVIVEAAAVLQRRLGMQAVRLFVTDLLPLVSTQRIEEDVDQAAWAALLAANRRSLSLVDCASFEVMRRLGIRTAFAFDGHFNEQGFSVEPTGHP